MPRQGRVVLPNYPLHVVQRGHNRQVVFAEDEDYQRYLSDLRDLKDAFGIKVYAFCLGIAWRAVPERCGKVAINRVSYRAMPTCWRVAGTSN